MFFNSSYVKLLLFYIFCFYSIRRREFCNKTRLNLNHIWSLAGNVSTKVKRNTEVNINSLVYYFMFVIMVLLVSLECHCLYQLVIEAVPTSQTILPGNTGAHLEVYRKLGERTGINFQFYESALTFAVLPISVMFLGTPIIPYLGVSLALAELFRWITLYDSCSVSAQEDNAVLDGIYGGVIKETAALGVFPQQDSFSVFCGVCATSEGLVWVIGVTCLLALAFFLIARHNWCRV